MPFATDIRIVDEDQDGIPVRLRNLEACTNKVHQLASQAYSDDKEAKRFASSSFIDAHRCGEAGWMHLSFLSHEALYCV